MAGLVGCRSIEFDAAAEKLTGRPFVIEVGGFGPGRISAPAVAASGYRVIGLIHPVFDRRRIRASCVLSDGWGERVGEEMTTFRNPDK
jgi:hypothetical protein